MVSPAGSWQPPLWMSSLDAGGCNGSSCLQVSLGCLKGVVSGCWVLSSRGMKEEAALRVPRGSRLSSASAWQAPGQLPQPEPRVHLCAGG